MDIVFALEAPQIVQFVLAIILPLAVGLVTTRVTASGTKAVLLAALSLVTALLTELLAANAEGVAYDLGSGLLSGLGTFIVAVALHFGLWKPTGASAAVQATFANEKTIDNVQFSSRDETPPQPW